MKIISKTTAPKSLLWISLTIVISFITWSCEDFVEVDPPNNQLIGAEVFEDANTIDAAFAHIYSQLRDNALTDGSISGTSYLLGHYADELELYSLSFTNAEAFSNHTVLSTDSAVKNWWDTSYNLIYAINSINEGVANSTSISEEDRSRFLGECYFLRGYIHFYLVNLFGEIPYINSTDYRVNQSVSRQSEAIVYQHIIDDFSSAKALFDNIPDGSENFRANFWSASAMLARAYLYNQNWELARDEAEAVILSGNYALELDLNAVFLKNSTETLWQLDAGMPGDNTAEGRTFIFVTAPPPNSAISSYLKNDFEPNDARFSNWLGSISEGSDIYYFPFKYKLNLPTGNTQECSILLRLAELYLITAEANAQLNNIPEALNYLNAIRERAALAPINSDSQTAVLEAILKERRIELFSELGHRFFDLKRTGKASEILSPIKPNWDNTRLYFPLPESKLILNPNLQPQNSGY